MTEQPQETTPQPGDNPDAPDPTTTDEPTTTQPPAENSGSGQFAVWDTDLGRYVSGVSDKRGAGAMRKELAGSEAYHNGSPLEGHDLQVREV